MSVRFAPHVMVMALLFLLSPLAWAQEETRRPAREQLQNPTAGARQNESAAQNRTQTTSGVETIRGVIAGVAAEGELMLDYRTNAAARVEGAFLTVIGSPVKSEVAANKDRQASGADSDQHGWSGRNRHNIYIAWLTPRTRIVDVVEHPGKSDQNQRQNGGQAQGPDERKEIAFDQLQVGDHVEIQFSPQDDSGASNNLHQNQQMRQKHGRHRTFVGYATSIMVRPATDHDKSRSGSDTRSSDRSQ